MTAALAATTAAHPRRAPASQRALLAALALVILCTYAFTAVGVLNRRVERQREVTGHAFAISDLFPRWLGAQAMLTGVSPFSEEFRADLHRAYYGEVRSREWERDTFRNICEFFYPPFVLVPLLPLLWLPFEVVRWLATAGLAGAIAAGVLLWLRHAGFALRREWAGAVAALAVIFYPSLDAILLQQLTGLVFLYVVAAVYLAGRGRHAPAGALLALAMIKPQSALIPAACLLFWSLWRRERHPLVATFAVVMAAQLALAEWLVPGWVPEFLAANARYREYNTIGFWLPGQLLGSDLLGAALIAAPLAALLAWGWWRARALPLASSPAINLVALTFVSGVILMPDISYYNKVLLLPAVALAVMVSHQGVARLRVTSRLVSLNLWAPVAGFALVGIARVLWGNHGAALGAWEVVARASEAHTLLLPLLVLPAAVVRVLPQRSEAVTANRFISGPRPETADSSLLRVALSSRSAPVVVSLVMSLALLVPATRTASYHFDESQYVWSAAYFGGRLARLDLSAGGSDHNIDPGWQPLSYWALTQPMGTRFVYALAMGITGVTAPPLPYMFDSPEHQGADTYVGAETLGVTRLMAVVCAALGLALLAARWGWRGTLALGLLAVPHVREDLARAWAEGPLLLGASACAVTFRTRWFPMVSGAVATLKLTALAAWPLVFLFHPIGRTRFARTLSLGVALGVWSLLTPPSWFAGGPVYLVVMALSRLSEYSGQSTTYSGPLGLFFPSRYLLPIEFGVVMLLITMGPTVAGSISRLCKKVSPTPLPAPVPGHAPAVTHACSVEGAS
jgi:hypothetical protein